MVHYTCESCTKTFAQKSHYDAHMARTRPCKKKESLETLIEKKVEEAIHKHIVPQNTVVLQAPVEDLSKKTREELIALCKERRVKGYSKKKRDELLELLQSNKGAVATVAPAALSIVKAPNPDAEPKKVQRLNYIGSKFKLLEWLDENILEKTGWPNFAGKRIADLFGGTGIVSHHFRTLGATVLSNDAELFSSIIVSAFTNGQYTKKIESLLQTLNATPGKRDGYVTVHYSPHNGNERKFFTVENAQRIDYVRGRIEELKAELTDTEYTYLLASLLVSADAVSNVPAVYGCYLKNFKEKARKPFRLVPLHTHSEPPMVGSRTHHSDVLSPTLLSEIECDVVYLDPPYNERQYSKNYFPLNIIAKTPSELTAEPPLKGKTGIPTDCFMSPFCRRGAPVEKAFDTLFKELKAEWIFVSYNSESIVSKSKMLELMGKYGTASVVQREYKRFKSFEYNEDKEIEEFLFCLRKTR